VSKQVARRASELRSDVMPPTRTSLRIADDQYGFEPSDYASFGQESWIVPPVRVLNPHRIAIGNGVVLMENATLAVLDGDAGPPLLTIGDDVHFTRFCSVVCEVGVTIGPSVASSDFATIVDTWRVPFAVSTRRLLPAAPVVIEANAYLAMNSIVGPGVHVGEGAYIGEGAVVYDDVPAHAVVYGNPAVVTRRFDPDDKEWRGKVRP
jgi:acetyltransferase-like isoleucine patch superfamily enzyme